MTPLTTAAPQTVPQLRTETTYERRVKPVLDRLLAVLLLATLSPLLLATAGLVRVGLGPGGVFYTQARVGKDGDPFRIYKFRTMRPDRRFDQGTYDGPDRRVEHKTDEDPRHTGVGRRLRALSIDELPQLINVVRGEMSLVGPRPEIVEVARAGGYLDHPRHLVRPGLTGPFQTSPLRGDSSLAAGLDLDLAYLDEISLRADLKYLAATVVTLLTRRGR